MCEECFPPRFWGLDPLFSAKAKLNVSDVLSLSCYPDFPGQHPGKDRVDTNMPTMLHVLVHPFPCTHMALSLSLSSHLLGVYCIGSHPVVGVHVMGDVVSVKKKSPLILYEGQWCMPHIH